MPKREDERNQRNHPSACTCVDCVDRFLGRRVPCPTCRNRSGRIVQIGSGEIIRCPTCFGSGTVSKEFLAEWNSKREAEIQRNPPEETKATNPLGWSRPNIAPPPPTFPKPSGHPAGCTCYACNEEWRRQGEKLRHAEADARLRDAEARLWAQLTNPQPPVRLNQRDLSGRRARAFRAIRRVTVTALLSALVIHVATLVGLLIYASNQEGASAVAPMLADAWEAYARAWRSVIDLPFGV